MTLSSGISPAQKDSVSQKYLVFKLGNEEYGIDILRVQEIRGSDRVTRIPNAQDFISGVTNLRGVIVPIVDLRIRFQLPEIRNDDNTVVIVLNLNDRIVGIVVDGVVDVISLNSESIKPNPDIASSLSARYLTGLGVIDERMLILINIEKLLSREEMEQVDAVSLSLTE